MKKSRKKKTLIFAAVAVWENRIIGENSQTETQRCVAGINYYDNKFFSRSFLILADSRVNVLTDMNKHKISENKIWRQRLRCDALLVFEELSLKPNLNVWFHFPQDKA